MASSLGTIARDLGRIFEVLGAIILVSIVIPLVWREWWVIPAMVISGLVPLLVGIALTRIFEDASEPARLHGMMIAASGWFFVAVFGALPFVLMAWTAKLDPSVLSIPARYTTHGTRAFSTLAAFQNPLNALFESMSGFTGTGLTMAVYESELPYTFQWWRSLIQWVGGVGVIVLTTAILARPGSGSLTLYESEARSEKIHPNIISTVHTIWWIFLLFTFFSILLVWLAGMPMWGAINHTMTGLATGGFSIADHSIGTYNSVSIEFALVVVMTLGSIAFPIHYLILRGDLRNLYTDLQTRWVFIFFGLGTLALTALLYVQGIYQVDSIEVAGVVLKGTAATLFQSFRYALFQFVSAASCTGFQTAGNLGSVWPPLTQLVVVVGMVIGAAAGSTVGGIKLIRALTLGKGIKFRINSVFYPSNAVRTFRLNGRALSGEEASKEFEEAAIIAILWVVFLALGVAVLTFALPVGPDKKFSVVNVLFEVATAQGNVGITTGITGPTMPAVTKIMLFFNMWIGRLEIIPVLVLLRGIFKSVGGYE